MAPPTRANPWKWIGVENEPTFYISESLPERPFRSCDPLFHVPDILDLLDVFSD